MAQMTRRGQLTTTAVRERTLKRGSLLSRRYSTYIELMRKILPLKVLSLRQNNKSTNHFNIQQIRNTSDM